MFYIIAYDQKYHDIDSSSIASVLSKYGDPRMVFNGLWLLTCNSSIDLDRLCKEVKEWIPDNQGLFIAELVNGKANGWLPVTIWDWYKSNLVTHME